MATQAEGGKEALRRLLRVAAEVQRDGIKVDGNDPGWRRLCREVERGHVTMTEEQMRERLIGLALVATELEN